MYIISFIFILFAYIQFYFVVQTYSHTLGVVFFNILYFWNFVDLWTVGIRRIPHSNMDTKSSIESYHEALKWWLSTDLRGLQGQRVDWLVWRSVKKMKNFHEKYMVLSKKQKIG